MQIVTPVTDYIPASLLTTNGDIVERLAGVNARLGARAMFRAHRSAVQTLVTGTQTLVEYDVEDFDIGGNYDHVTDFDFTVPRDGYYMFAAGVSIGNIGPNKVIALYIIHNIDGNIAYYWLTRPTQVTTNIKATAFWYCEAGELITVEVTQNHGLNKDIGTSNSQTWFWGVELI